jgi:hypothetical protein
MTARCTFVATYETHTRAEESAGALQRAGYEASEISVIGRGEHSAAQGTGDGDPGLRWGKTAEFWGGIWEVGSTSFFLPGVGPLVIGGPLAGTVLGILDRGFVEPGLTTLGAALLGVGVPADAARDYEREIAANRCLLVLRARVEDLPEVRRMIGETGPGQLEVHGAELAAATA